MCVCPHWRLPKMVAVGIAVGSLRSFCHDGSCVRFTSFQCASWDSYLGSALFQCALMGIRFLRLLSEIRVFCSLDVLQNSWRGGSWADSYHWNLMPGMWMNEQLGGGGGGGDRSGERIACLGHVRIIMLRFFLWWGWCFSWKNRLHGTWKTLLVVYTGCSRFALCIHEIAISPPTLVFAGVTCLRFQHLLIRMIVTHFSRALLTSVCSGRGRSAAKTVLHAGCDG